jgi:RNA polymerase sigma-70 factor (ECF subfamily)
LRFDDKINLILIGKNLDSDTTEKINNCIEKISQGEFEYVPILHSLIGSVLYFKGFKYLRNKEEAEDLVQDFWLNIQRYCLKYRYVSNGYGFLLKAFDNSALMKLRQLKRLPCPIDVDLIREYEKDNCKQDITENQIALRDSIRRSVKDFTDLEKKIFALTCYEDKTIRQISKEVDVSRATTYRLQQKIMEVIEKNLAEDEWQE